ncbi:MAG: T9SS type A sorting domain-containing protein [Bacteroidota bacterium]
MRSFLIPLLLITQLSLIAQPTEWVGPTITCFARDTSQTVFLPPIDLVLNGMGTPGSTFELDFTSDVPLEAQQALTFAAEIWGLYLVSSVPVRVEVDWQDRMDNRLLASAGPTTVQRAFAGSANPFIWYPVALTEAITGQNQNGNAPDIRIIVNSTANWYFGIDGQTPFNQIDLVSVTLHELGHGIGFLATTDTISTTQAEYGIQGLPIIYDSFVEDDNGVAMTNETAYPNPSTNLLDLITVEEAFFGGPNTVLAFNGPPPLFTPGLFDIGSSVSHLCEFEFSSGSENALMTPQISRGEAIHDPGSGTLAMLQDMGWTINSEVLSINEIFSSTLHIHPNPSSGVFTFEVPERAGLGDRYLVYNLSGQEVSSGQIHRSGLESVDLTDLSAGSYFLVLRGENSIWREKIVKE